MRGPESLSHLHVIMLLVLRGIAEVAVGQSVVLHELFGVSAGQLLGVTADVSVELVAVPHEVPDQGVTSAVVPFADADLVLRILQVQRVLALAVVLRVDAPFVSGVIPVVVLVPAAGPVVLLLVLPPFEQRELCVDDAAEQVEISEDDLG